MAVVIKGTDSSNEVAVGSDNRLKVDLAQASTPEQVGAVRFFSENDSGEVMDEPYLLSPETDDDYRLRTALDQLIDIEIFNYTAQNTGKHLYRNTTISNSWSAAGLTTNSGNATTTATGTIVQSYQYYPLYATTQLYCEFESSFSNQPTTNTIIDVGLALAATTWPYAATDGAYFRMTSAGLTGIVNNNGTETSTGVLSSFTYSNNEKHQFIIAISTREVEFWVDNVLYGSIPTPIGQGQPFMAASVPLYVRHAISGGAAGAVMNLSLNSYSITLAGAMAADKLSTIGNRMLGSYQGLSGGTMGSLANYANSANPTAAVPTNTTAALGSGLGGQFWETDTLTVTTDGIICSYQVPAGTANVQGRRLVVRGVNIQSFVQTVLVGGPYVAQWSLAFGHTAVSLATLEAATTKAPRRVGVGLQAVTAAAAVSTVLTPVQINFDSPIYVNPGEFIQVVKKKVGTAVSSGVIGHLITFNYGWE